jgi:hypothetical protein
MVQIRSMPVSRLPIGLLVLQILLVCPVSGYQNAPGIALKGGIQRLTSPLTFEKVDRARFELELCTPRLLDGHVDLAASFGFSPLGSLSDSSSDVEDGLLVDRWSHDDLQLFDLRLGARLFPLGHTRSIIAPYVGAGLGYFWFVDQWEDNISATDPETSDSAYDSNRGTETVAQGLFPFVVAGFNVTLAEHAELLFEVQYDVEREDHGYDLSGPSYLIGARLRW